MNAGARNALLELAVKTYGRRDQEDMMIEEMSELTKAILKLRRTRASEGATDGELLRIIDGRRADIIEEMADVQIMLDQLRIIYGSTDEAEAAKLERLAGRLGHIEPVDGLKGLSELMAGAMQIPVELAAKVMGVPYTEGGAHDE